MVATFSNYGATAVDLFAPGYHVLSSVPGDQYQALDGTSMASPVVAGVAALILSHRPQLSGAEVKTLILDTAKRYATTKVYRPGSRTKVNFGSLSRTGGIVDAQAAVARLYQ